jgi:hypothetical protein
MRCLQGFVPIIDGFAHGVFSVVVPCGVPNHWVTGCVSQGRVLGSPGEGWSTRCGSC